MASLSVSQQEIYKDLRGMMIELFPESFLQVIQAAQNNNALPHNAIVMQMLFTNNLDTAVVNYDEPVSMGIQNSVEARMQIDFYGTEAETRSRIVANIWRTDRGCSMLRSCQPLYVHSHNRHVYVNDSNQYEDRWILDLSLQYNPQVIVAQDFADTAAITQTPVL